MTYEEVIKNLFSVLAVCNAADSRERQTWQHYDDSSQRFGAYGDIRKAIIKLAGEEIVDHWADTNEIDMSLASRNR